MGAIMSSYRAALIAICSLMPVALFSDLHRVGGPADVHASLELEVPRGRSQAAFSDPASRPRPAEGGQPTLWRSCAPRCVSSRTSGVDTCRTWGLEAAQALDDSTAGHGLSTYCLLCGSLAGDYGSYPYYALDTCSSMSQLSCTCGLDRALDDSDLLTGSSSAKAGGLCPPSSVGPSPPRAGAEALAPLGVLGAVSSPGGHLGAVAPVTAPREVSPRRLEVPEDLGGMLVRSTGFVDDMLALCAVCVFACACVYRDLAAWTTFADAVDMQQPVLHNSIAFSLRTLHFACSTSVPYAYLPSVGQASGDDHGSHDWTCEFCGKPFPPMMPIVRPRADTV